MFSGGVEDDVEYAEESEDTREGDEEQGEVKEEEEEEDEEEEENKEINDISSLLKEVASGEKNEIKTENLGKRKLELMVSEEPAKKKKKKKQKKTKDMEKCKVGNKWKILFIPVRYFTVWRIRGFLKVFFLIHFSFWFGSGPLLNPEPT